MPRPLARVSSLYPGLYCGREACGHSQAAHFKQIAGCTYLNCDCHNFKRKKINA